MRKYTSGMLHAAALKAKREEKQEKGPEIPQHSVYARSPAWKAHDPKPIAPESDKKVPERPWGRGERNDVPAKIKKAVEVAKEQNAKKYVQPDLRRVLSVFTADEYEVLTAFADKHGISRSAIVRQFALQCLGLELKPLAHRAHHKT